VSVRLTVCLSVRPSVCHVPRNSITVRARKSGMILAQNKMSVAMIGQVEGRKLTLEVRPIYDIIINKIDLSKA